MSNGPGPSLHQMADALRELVVIERKRLNELDELTYRQGLKPGEDVSFAGVRILIEQTDAAHQLLRKIAPYEDAFRMWLEARAQPNSAPAAAS
jgi:hypothetical protein